MTTVNVFDDMEPTPRAEVLIPASELDPTAVTLDVLQVSGGVERVVRDAEGIAATGGVFITDYEIPFGVQVTYQARQYNSSGVVLGLTDGVSVQLDVDGAYVVFQDPFAPGRALRVEGTGSFADQVSRSRPTSVYRVGADTIALSGELTKVQGAGLSVATRTLTDADSLLSLLAFSPLLVRTMPSAVRIPPLFYCAIRSVVELPMDVQWGGEWIRWDLIADEVSRPDLQTLEPAITWQRYVDSFVTWQDMIDEYPTWLDAISNPPAEA